MKSSRQPGPEGGVTVLSRILAGHRGAKVYEDPESSSTPYRADLPDGRTVLAASLAALEDRLGDR
jgi:hypothetical protein